MEGVGKPKLLDSQHVNVVSFAPNGLCAEAETCWNKCYVSFKATPPSVTHASKLLLWKCDFFVQWGGLMSSSFETTPNTWTLAGNLVPLTKGTSLTSWANQQTFLRFTWTCAVKIFLSEKTWGDHLPHSLGT